VRKKLDIGQTLNTLANIGVIAGILFLVVELSQKNDFLELEAEATRVENLLAAWDRIVSDPDLVTLFIKDRNEEALTESEEMQLNAFWMGYLIRMEWRYQYFPEPDQGFNSMQRVFASYGSIRRTWNGNSTGSRVAGKDNFSREFVSFVDDRIFVER
jgi:hypothetical protein